MPRVFSKPHNYPFIQNAKWNAAPRLTFDGNGMVTCFENYGHCCSVAHSSSQHKPPPICCQQYTIFLLVLHLVDSAHHPPTNPVCWQTFFALASAAGIKKPDFVLVVGISNRPTNIKTAKNFFIKFFIKFLQKLVKEQKVEAEIRTPSADSQSARFAVSVAPKSR